MKMIKDLNGNYPDCIVTYFGFEELMKNYEEIDNSVLCIGYNCMWNQTVLDHIKDHEVKIFFNGEQPCAYSQEKRFGLRSADVDNLFTDIYTICPYTADWANKLYNTEGKFKRALFPIKEKNIVHSTEKKYDAIFYGSICSNEHADTIEAISKFNYKFITLGREHWYPNEKVDNIASIADKITDTNIHTFQKWQILSQTKIVPIFNQLYLHDKHIAHIKSYDHWQENKAFSHLEQKMAPQLKPRITEAALFKMLMLVKRDPWNAIEYWYEPDKDFIYFDSVEELPDLIADITNNWDDYQSILENAYNKAFNNYTTEALLARMIRETRR
jgi:hypothetical protein